MICSFLKIAFVTTLGFILFTQSPVFACDCGSTKSDLKNSQVGLKTVQEAIKNSPSAVVAFHSASCGTCKVQKPRLQTLLLKDQNTGIKNIFLDFDSETEVRKDLKVAYPSTIIVFKNGSEVARVTGVTDENELQKILNQGTR